MLKFLSVFKFHRFKMHELITFALLLTTLNILNVSCDVDVEPYDISSDDAEEIRSEVFRKMNYHRTDKHLWTTLDLDTSIQNEAQKAANTLAPQYTNKDPEEIDLPPHDKYGQTKYVGSSFKYVGEVAADLWYLEMASIESTQGENFYEYKPVANLCQLLWKESKKVGVGVAKNRIKNLTIIVVFYDPPGNKKDEYEQNLPKFTPQQISSAKDHITQISYVNFILLSKTILDPHLGVIPGWTSVLHPDVRLHIESHTDHPEYIKFFEEVTKESKGNLKKKTSLDDDSEEDESESYDDQSTNKENTNSNADKNGDESTNNKTTDSDADKDGDESTSKAATGNTSEDNKAGKAEATEE